VRVRAQVPKTLLVQHRPTRMGRLLAMAAITTGVSCSAPDLPAPAPMLPERTTHWELDGCTVALPPLEYREVPSSCSPAQIETLDPQQVCADRAEAVDGNDSASSTQHAARR
jgi:hypothetical protein